MRVLLRWCVFFACWCAVVSGAQPSAVLLSEMPDAMGLGLRAQVLEDPERQLTLDQILAAGDELPWQASASEALNFSFSSSVYWVRLRLVNDTGATQTRVLEAGSALQDFVDIHLVRAGTATQSFETGDRRAFATRPLPYRYPVVPVVIEPAETLDLVLRLDTHDGLFEAIPITLRTPANFSLHGQLESIAFGAYYGAIVALLLYNLLLFTLTRDTLFLQYVLYLSAYTAWNLCFTGYGFQYLWPTSPDLNNQMIAVMVPLIFVTLSVFSMSYLRTRLYSPRLHWALWGLTVLCALQTVTGLLDWYAWTFITILPIGGVLLIVQLAAAARIALLGYRPARFYLLAWTALAIGAIVTFLKVFDVIPSSPLVEYSLNIGSALEFVLLALALADQMNRLKAEKLAAEQRALAVQTALAGELEQKVQERTQELQLANAQLQTVAITDALTGVYNRRYFDTILKREFNRCMRQKLPMALCMLDIDSFKRFNDLYGHQRGDEALIAVAKALSGRVQRSTEYLFRLGGEEFAMLVVDEPREKAWSHLEALRVAVEQSGISHSDSPAGVVTVSCGMAWMKEPEGSTDTLYALADQALYRAKQAGRNQSSE